LFIFVSEISIHQWHNKLPFNIKKYMEDYKIYT